MKIFIFSKSYITGSGNLVWEYGASCGDTHISNVDMGHTFIKLNSGVIYK